MDLFTCAHMKKVKRAGTRRFSELPNKLNCGRAKIFGAQIMCNT